MLVAGFIAWHLVLVRLLIYPVKLCVVAWHEFGHLAAIVLAGRHVEAVSIDPNEGGLGICEFQVKTWTDSRTVTPAGGITAYPLAALPWGYLSSILIGGALSKLHRCIALVWLIIMQHSLPSTPRLPKFLASLCTQQNQLSSFR